MKPTLAFLGIGLMGKPMADNLLKAGYPMKLWNRTQSKAEVFSDRAEIAATPQEAVEGADFIVLMLENGAIVNDVLISQGTLDRISQGAMIIDMSSIPPATARKHADLARKQGVAYLDAPVSGGTVGAEKAQLSIMAGGQEDDFIRAQEIFAVLGRSTYIGPAGAGQLAKLANQAIVGITIGAVSEALLLAAKGGANPVAVREALMGGFASSRILELHGERMLKREFHPGATARVQHKDMKMILDEAKESGLQLPLAEQVFAEYDDMLSEGLENVDHSGLLLHLERLNNTRLTVDEDL
ncbi:NAD(P)-dependent oxidoreductase [Hahella ganghwensis]|uniref:NAD(P)-dependent oxidoreductase n=1 Tax=Hahella ganghwensis TaxID=286420 RepID=UPI00035CD53B|nr:NAD(P)-dependent oxidoreductase [Hahella ganghwensis]